MTTELQQKKEHFDVTGNIPIPDLTATLVPSTQWYESMQKTINFMVDQRMEEHIKTIKDTIQSSYQKSSESEIDIMKVIVGIKRDVLKEFVGKYVAITYEGEITDSDPLEIELLKRISTKNIPKEQKIFTYLVPPT